MTLPATDKPHAGQPWAPRQWLGAAAVAGLFVLVDRVHIDGSRSLLADVPSGARSALYISISASCAALLGFAITATSILLVLGSGSRMNWLRRQPAFQQTRVIFIGAIVALALGTTVYTVMIVIDTGREGAWPLEAIAAGVVALVVTRMIWVLWLLNELLKLSLRDQGSDAPTAMPFTEPLDD
jgi:hypothetical protein